MGQYHILVNLDKREVVIPHDIGLGSKQYEHTGIDGSLSDAMYLLVMSSPESGGGDFPEVEGASGRWCGDRVVIVGDYTQDNAIPGIEFSATLYEIASTSYSNISPIVREAFKRIFDIAYKPEEVGNYTIWSRVG
jgi:hypothetical protein